MTPAETLCLNCGESREWAKTHKGWSCGIESVGEVRELVEEWPHHRWAPWTDAELHQFGIKPEAYDKHRRTQGVNLQWVACEDTTHGHVLITDETERAYWGLKPGQCMACGFVTAAQEVTL